MKYLKILFVPIYLFLLGNVELKAHNPGNVTYTFHETAKTLTIQFATRATVDLLHARYPALKSYTVLDLSEFSQALTQYFNETICFLVNEKSARFTFQNADFGPHEATMVFRLEGLSTPWEKVSTTIRSFTEVYQKPSNLVILNHKNGTETFLLDATDQDGNIEISKGVTTTHYRHFHKTWVYVMVLISLSGIMLWLGYRRQPID